MFPTDAIMSLSHLLALDDRCEQSDLVPILFSVRPTAIAPGPALLQPAGAPWPSGQASSSFAFWAANSASVNVPLSRNVASLANSSAELAVPAV